MSKLFEIVLGLISGEDLQRRFDEAFLAESVDVFDLERRMRAIDRGLR